MLWSELGHTGRQCASDQRSDQNSFCLCCLYITASKFTSCHARACACARARVLLCTKSLSVAHRLQTACQNTFDTHYDASCELSPDNLETNHKAQGESDPRTGRTSLLVMMTCRSSSSSSSSSCSFVEPDRVGSGPERESV